jgi:hypothetical protein
MGLAVRPGILKLFGEQNMMSLFIFRYQLNQHFAQQDRVRKDYTSRIAKARKKGVDSEELDQLISEAWMEETLITDEVSLLVTRFWLRRAQRLFVPTPDRKDGEMWRECRNRPNPVLTEMGISVVRAAVRDEEKASREVWMLAVTGITGVIGSLTGLLAVFFAN